MIIGGCRDDATFYRSDDMGITWASLGTIPGLTGLTALLADARNPDIFIAAGWRGAGGWCGYPSSPYDAVEGNIYCSTDGGITWNAAMNGSVIGGVTGLFRDKDNPDLVVASATGYTERPSGGGLGGVFVSMDGGASWERRNDGLPPFTMNGNNPMISALVSPPSGQTLYCAVQLNGGFYRSNDLGRTWSKIAELPIRIPDDYIENYLCDLTIRRTAVTQILPLNDGTGSFLASTMGQGIFKGSPAGEDCSGSQAISQGLR